MTAELVGAAADIICCASCGIAACGIAALDNVKLKKCACKLAQYCSVECQKNHRPQHKKACKKRLAEMRDDALFAQLEISHYGECPICCLPIPMDDNKSKINSCCCKIFCNGCNYANKKREWEQGLEYKCPYCREPVPDTEEEIDENLMRRIKANDPIAMNEMGVKRHNEGDYEKAFEYYTTAAGLGDADSHYNLSIMYSEGQGVEKDLKKKVYHLEEAAIGGHPDARFNIGNNEFRNGRKNRAAKHWIIAAKLGYDDALHNVKQGVAYGFVSKEDYDAALRGHQAAVDATKSEQRDAAEKFFK